MQSARLRDESEPAEVSVGAYADVVGGGLGWVVDCAGVGHGVGGYGVEVGFWEAEGEGEDVEEPFGESGHGGVVAVEGGAEEERLGVGGPLVERVRGGRKGEVLFRVGGVFAHEEAFFEVWVGVLI